MLSENPIVSIIIPAYNYGQFISECLDSVIAQTFSNWECIVVDNGSTDNTAEIVKSYAAKESRISYYFTEQKGVSFARNLAVSYSKGDYILPLDADDRIATTYVAKALKILTDQPQVKVAYCEAELFGAFTGRWMLPEFSIENLLIENSIFCTALFRKKDFEAAKGFNEEMKEGFEDWDFWIRMLGNGGEVYKIPEVLFYYRMRASSRNGVLHDQKQLDLRRRIYTNHKALYDKTFVTPDLIFELYNLKLQLNALQTSTDKKLGTAVLNPLRYLKNLFNFKKG
jgi:glycosyltransferase involved in cell wall biosynthesis